MKLRGITINKFRIFSHVEFSFADRFNLISGSHASGKTSLLDAVALALGEFTSAVGADPLSQCRAGRTDRHG
jgi:predicted ATP-dependent endonuclease of OLD family